MPANLAELQKIAIDAKDAARRMYAVTESLDKYLTKQGKLLKAIPDLRKLTKQHGKQITTAEKILKNTEKIAKKSEKVTDALKKLAFKEINPKWGAVMNSLFMAASAGITLLAIKTNEEVQEIDLRKESVKEAELNKNISLTQKIIITQRQQDTAIKDVKERIDKSNADTANAARAAQDARKLANDALYETRQGRVKLEQSQLQIQQKQKQQNDLLYAEKQERLKLGIKFAENKAETDNKFNQLKNQFQQLTNTVTKGANESIQTTINQLKQGVQEAKQESKAAKDFATTVQKTLEIAKGISDALKIGLQATTVKAENALQEALKNGATLKLIDGKIQIATETAAKNWGAKVWEPKIYQAQQQIGALAAGQVALASDVAQFKQEALGKVSRGEFKTEIGSLEQQNTKLKQEIESLKTNQKNADTKTNENTKKIEEQEKLNKEGIKKIENLVPLLTAIPPLIVREGQLTRNKVPTIPDIQTGMETAICNSSCLANSQNALGDRINANANTNHNNLLDKLNLAGQGIDLGLLTVINDKMGGKVDGGLSGMLQRFSQNAIVTRALNLMIFATTLHNALMLSNNLGQTLISILNNVLGFFGVKNGEGQNVDLGQVIGSSIENFVKSLIGTEAYTQLSNDLAKANRIYQATTNLLNQVQSLHNSVLSALEMGFGWTAKIGNALKKWGAIGESAYQWMNPSPNFKWRVFQYLETAQQGASTVESIVTSVVDVKEQFIQLAQIKTELEQALGNQTKDSTAAKAPEAEVTKAEQIDSKSVSEGAAISLSDIFNANE